MEAILNNRNIEVWINPATLERMKSKLITEDFAIFNCYGQNRTLDEVQSINSDVQKYLAKNNARCYNMIFQNEDNLQETTLVFRNTSIMDRGQFFDLSLNVSLGFTKESFLICLNKYELRIIEANGEQIYNPFEKMDIIKTIEFAFSEI